jgi:hypothetical protein
MELPSYRKTWRNFKCTELSERSQLEKSTYCVEFWSGQNYGNCKKLTGSQRLGKGGMKRTAFRGTVGPFIVSV